MSEAEVGIFVQRLRGLMNEIGEGLEVGWRRAFRGPADPSPIPPTILYCKERTISVVSSVDRWLSQEEWPKEFYQEESDKKVQRAFLPEGALALSLCVLLILTLSPFYPQGSSPVIPVESHFRLHAFRL